MLSVVYYDACLSYEMKI